MSKPYPHIFSPITIGGVTFKNRIWAGPAGTHLLQRQETYPADATIAYYREKASGGSAVITVSCENMDRLKKPDAIHNNYTLFAREAHGQWVKLTDAIHEFGAKASIEFLAFTYHGYDQNGRLKAWSVNGGVNPDNGRPMQMMPADEIQRVAETYAEAAENAVACGFDIILLHFGHGLMISQFMSPLYNQRQDQFGGSFANRIRFAEMIIDQIRARVGRKILLEVRISGNELAGEGQGGWEEKDTIEFVKKVQDRIDIIQVSTGSMLNGTEHIMHPISYFPAGCNAYLAAAVKASPEVKIPVLTLGGFQPPDLIEETLAEGKADLVAMVRGSIADSHCVNKALDGKADEIIPCIRCLHCLDYGRAEVFGCSVNPRAGREIELADHLPSAQCKKVVIIGGGPAGMAAAIYCLEQGHDVTLYERSKALGGKLIFAKYSESKSDLANFMNYQIHMMDKLGVSLKLSTEATPQLIVDEKADVVIAALGAFPLLPPIPGIDGANVLTAEECYIRPDQVGQRVVVIGGGDVGCETAIFLLRQDREISIVEMKNTLAADSYWMYQEYMTQVLASESKVYLNARCKEINDRGAIVIDPSGNEILIPADTVVIAAGMQPQSQAAESYRQTAPLFWNIGDSLQAKNVLHCTRSAFEAVRQI